MPRTPKQSLRTIRKTELHQHVDGSIPLRTTWRLMREHGLQPVATAREMRRLLQLQPEEEGSLLAYLDKFHYPMWITQFYENIVDVTREIVLEAYGHGVRLLELRYSPAIHTFSGLSLRQAIRAVLSGMNAAVRRHRDLEVGLIVISMRQHGPHIAKIMARQALAEAQHLHERSGVVGFDLAGAERGNPPRLSARPTRSPAGAAWGSPCTPARTRGRSGSGRPWTCWAPTASVTAARPSPIVPCCGAWRGTRCWSNAV
jgi:adenosine deaminase